MQDREGETDGPFATLVLERVGAVELFSDVGGHFLVELSLQVGELVADGVGEPLGEQRLAVELEELLLDEAAHEVGRVRDVDAVTKLAFEPVAVEKRHEELEVFLFAVVRGGRHQEEVAREAGEETAQLVALRLLDLAAEEGGATSCAPRRRR